MYYEQVYSNLNYMNATDAWSVHIQLSMLDKYPLQLIISLSSWQGTKKFTEAMHHDYMRVKLRQTVANI